MAFRRAYWLAVLMLLWLCGGPLHAEGRFALVIGINDYANVPKLLKATNDARAVATALGGLGFDVTLSLDPDRTSLDDTIDTFEARLSAGDSVAFYFAGHGVAIDGRNYLLARDVPSVTADSETRLKREGLPVDFLTDSLRDKQVGVTLMILDACRNNPFPKTGTRGIGQERGLSEGPAARGTFILFSAGDGESAVDNLGPDDKDPNSVFTRSLLPLLAEPGLTVQDIAIKLRKRVYDLSATIGVEQFPGYYDQLDGEFRFSAAVAPVPTVRLMPAPALQAWAEAGSLTASGPVAALQASPDGSKLAISTLRGETTVWAIAEGRQLSDLHSNGTILRSIQFLNNGAEVAGVLDTFGFAIWNAATGDLIAKKENYSEVATSLAVPIAGTLLAAITDGGHLYFWDLKRKDGSVFMFRAPVGGLGEDRVSLADVSPTGDALVLGQTDRIRLIDPANQREIWSSLHPKGYAEDVSRLQFSPDGTRILEVGHSGLVRLLQTSRGLLVQSYQSASPAQWGAFLQDGEHLVLVSRTANSAAPWSIDLVDLGGAKPQTRQIATSAIEPVVAVGAGGHLLAISMGNKTVSLWSDGT